MKRFTILIIFVLTFISLSAQTDSTNIDELFNLSLEELLDIEITGVSRYKQNISEVHNSIQVVTNQQIVDRGYFDLSDLLKDINGVDITSTAGRFGEFYSLRGIGGNDRFLVLINGHKLNPSSGTFISVGNSISIRYAERVEIIYGPASAVYGADAFSGVINIVFNETIYKKQKLDVSAYGNYGSMNSLDGGFKASINVNKDLSFYASARIYKSDGFDVLGTDTVYNILNNYLPPLANNIGQPINDHSVYFNTKYKNFSLNYYRKQFDQGNAFGFNPDMYVYDKDNKWKNSTDILWATYIKKFDESKKLTFDVSYKNHTQDKNTIFHKWKSISNVDESFKQYMTGKDNTIHGSLTYNHQYSKKIQYVVGVDNEYTTSIPAYANDEVLGDAYKYEGENAKTIDNELTITENRFSGFGQFIYSPVKIVNIILGARYDYSSRYNGVFNPRAGLTISPTNTTKINILYGRAFQAPSLFHQYEQFGTPAAIMVPSTEFHKSNVSWHLENQIVNSYEINLSQKIGENYKIKVDAYYNDLTNLIERNLYAEYPEDSVYNRYFDTYTSGIRNENIGSQKIVGGDLMVNAKIAKNILIYTCYSYTDAVSIDEEGIETLLPRISKHKACVGITFQDLFGYVTTSPRLRWVGDMNNLNTEIFPDNNQPGYYTVDLNLSVKNISKYFRVYANFENIFNQKVDHSGLFRQTGVYTAVIPQPGFTFRAGVEFNFNK